MQLPITIKLNKPVKHGEAEVTELVFNRRVVAGDMRGVYIRKAMLWDELLLVAGRVAGVPPSVMNQLEFTDASEIAMVTMTFLMVGQETGNVVAA